MLSVLKSGYFLYGTATIFSIIYYFFNSKKLEVKKWIAPVIAVLVHIGGLVMCAGFAKIESGFDKSANFSLFGAIFFSPLWGFGLHKLFKVKYKTVMDFLSLSLCVSAVMMRLNCIFSGCCIGDYLFPGKSSLRYPVREIEIVFYLILSIIMVIQISKNKINGFFFPALMLSYGSLRFVLSFMRYGHGSVFALAHLWSIIAVIAGASVLCEMLAKRQALKKGGKKSD